MMAQGGHLSYWEKKMVDIPQIGSAEEIDFEQRFEGALEKKIR